MTPELRARLVEALSALARAKLSEASDAELRGFALAEGISLDGLTEEVIAAFRGPSCQCVELTAELERER
ncbi:MAG TPA: hypothetical protein VN894_09595, partial [Polyangiaceae bacterium]|nr:hypothetical protein [Polyangiaceae bacterium]